MGFCAHSVQIHNLTGNIANNITYTKPTQKPSAPRYRVLVYATPLFHHSSNGGMKLLIATPSLLSNPLHHDIGLWYNYVTTCFRIYFHHSSSLYPSSRNDVYACIMPPQSKCAHTTHKLWHSNAQRRQIVH